MAGCAASAAQWRAAHVTRAGPSGMLPSWIGSRLTRARPRYGSLKTVSANFTGCSQHPTGRFFRSIVPSGCCFAP
eukprot:1059389-Lingulodinium_polyedra.AAC.1